LGGHVGGADDGRGDVYVADTGNSRIQKCDASGTFLLTWGSFGSGNGQFFDRHGVATDGSGDVYVADTDNNRIQKFDASGTFLTTWGTPRPHHGARRVRVDGDGEWSS